MSSSKRQARRIIFQAAYSLGEDMFGNLSKMLIKTRPMIEGENQSEADESLVKELIAGMKLHREAALESIEMFLEVPMETISRVEQVVMMLAAVEMRCRPSTPRAVVINEWLEISKEFGAQDGFKLVNVVLDKLPRVQDTGDGD